MPVTLPETLQYGKVVGRFILAVADAPEDPDALPNAAPAVGTISFTSMNPLTKETAATPPTTVVRSVISAAIDNNGYLYNPKDPTGPRGIWLVAGPYKVSYALNTGAIAGHDILVLPTHNDANPLDLISALPPGGPILTASQYAEVSARIDALEVSGGASSFSELSGDPGDNAALAAALAAKASADSIPTWGSIGGKPAVVAAGATAAAARDAIGAGVSNLQIGTGVNDAAAGDRAATESMTGMVERATEGEVLAGTDTTRYVSPAGLAAALDARGSGFTWWDGEGEEPSGPDGEFVVTPA